MTSLPEEVRGWLLNQAVASPEREVCGFVLHSTLGWEVHPVTNDSERDDQFNMKSDEMLAVYRSRHSEIVGVYHSHPRGRKEPSDRDAVYANPNWRYWIVTMDDVHEWSIKDGVCSSVS